MAKKKRSRLKGLRAYLAGTMEYAADDGVEWRKSITPRLEKLGIVVLDPTDRPVRLSYADNSASEQLHLLKEMRRKGKFKKLIKCAKEIVHQDLRMVDVADLLIVYIDASVPTVGTIDEFVTASNQQKPILMVCKQGIREIPIWFWGRIGNTWKKTFFGDFKTMEDRLKRIAYCSNEELDGIIDRGKWLFLND